MKDKAILAILVAICVVVPAYFVMFAVPTPTVSASVPFAPIKVNMQNETALAYEIEFSDFDLNGLKLKNAKVFCADNGTLLQDIQGDYLATTFHARSIPAPTPDELWHGTGKLMHARLSVFIALANSTGLTALRHEFTFSWSKGADVQMSGFTTKCQNWTVPIIGLPMSGPEWLGIETSCVSSHHMAAQITIDNVTRCCQRYAVDYMMMKSDLSLYSANISVNSDWYCYGKELLAVADGVVTQVTDGIWENTPPLINSNLTMDQAGGNMVILDIGGGNYAQYAHMIPGSIRVEIGQHVTKGQVLGLLGNSGNSNGPHLHFQLGSDPKSILASEGYPFLFEHYEVNGLLLFISGEPSEIDFYTPPQQWYSSWIMNNEWMTYGG